jgi:hypothetical protein
MSSSESILSYLTGSVKTINVDYTPQWERGRPSTFINTVTFPRVLNDKQYKYHLINGSQDLGIKHGYTVQSDGSQMVNFLEWNAGHGLSASQTIKVFVVDPDSNHEFLVCQWN